MYRMTLILASTIVLTATSTATTLAQGPVIRNLEYTRLDERSLQLDIYQTASYAEADQPLVIWIHGGAWRAGSRGSVPVLDLLKHGFAVASVDYRLSPEAQFPAQLHDLHAAIRFCRDHASEYGFDAERFVVAGASAGGHLAALTGVTSDVDELLGPPGSSPKTSSRVQAIVSFYGASNLQTILSQSTPHGLSVRVPALQLLLGGQPDDRPRLAELASPVAHVDQNDPPLWLIHGDADPQMPPEQSQELAAVYRKHKLPVQLEMLPGSVHGGREFYAAERMQRIAEQLHAALKTPRVPTANGN